MVLEIPKPPIHQVSRRDPANGEARFLLSRAGRQVRYYNSHQFFAACINGQRYSLAVKQVLDLVTFLHCSLPGQSTRCMFKIMNAHSLSQCSPGKT